MPLAGTVLAVLPESLPSPPFLRPISTPIRRSSGEPSASSPLPPSEGGESVSIRLGSAVFDAAPGVRPAMASSIWSLACIDGSSLRYWASACEEVAVAVAACAVSAGVAAVPPPSWRSIIGARPRPRPSVSFLAICWSYISRNSWFSPGNSESPKLASRIDLTSICANWPSNCLATSLMRALSRAWVRARSAAVPGRGSEDWTRFIR